MGIQVDESVESDSLGSVEVSKVTGIVHWKTRQIRLLCASETQEDIFNRKMWDAYGRNTCAALPMCQMLDANRPTKEKPFGAINIIIIFDFTEAVLFRKNPKW